MDYYTFKMEFMELVQKKISGEVRISLEKIPKNNGIYMEGMVLSKSDDHASPIIYLEELYRIWKKGVSMEQLVEKVLWCYRNFEPEISISEDFFRDYEKLKSHIYYKLVNYEKNRELLKKIPHRRILDLAMVFYYQAEEISVPATILIQNSHLNRWKITEEELEENARKYTCLRLPAEFLTMASLAGVEEEDMDELLGKDRCPMYILTNKQRRFGAGVILYPGIMEQAQSLLGDNFYILPSSVHECILAPESSYMSQEQLSQMIREINEEHVEVQEVLSNQAYYYMGEDGSINI